MLKVNEIFVSIQGESTYAGLPCVFIRLTGCNLRCVYCDTTYAYEEGSDYSIDAVMKEVAKYKSSLIEITGGEPLKQTDTHNLAESLLNDGRTVLIETNGSLDISCLNPAIIKIMDIKTPGSGENEKMNWTNINFLSKNDNAKFVITNEDDFNWAIDIIRKFKLTDRTQVIFSPAFEMLTPDKLAQWLIQISLPIRMQLQMHKYIWHPTQRGV